MGSRSNALRRSVDVLNPFESESRFENALPLSFFTPGAHSRPFLCYALYTEVELASHVLMTVHRRMGETDWRLRQDWQPLPLRMTRGDPEKEPGHRYGKRHDVHSLTFPSGGWWSFMFENSTHYPRKKTAMAHGVLSERCFGQPPKRWGVGRADRTGRGHPSRVIFSVQLPKYRNDRLMHDSWLKPQLFT